MKKQLITVILILAMTTTPTTKPISPAATAITCGLVAAGICGLWNINLEPQTPAENTRKTEIKKEPSFKEFIKKNKEKIIHAAKIIGCGAFVGYIGYKAHPIIASVFTIMPSKPAKKHIEFFKYKNIEEIEKNWEEFRANYRKETLKLHPDKNRHLDEEKQKEASGKFMELTEHYKPIETYHNAMQQKIPKNNR